MFDFNRIVILFVLTFFVFSTFNSMPAQETQFYPFYETQMKINELEYADDYAGTIEYIESIRDQFPDYQFEIYLELAYCNMQLGHFKKAMDLWEEAHGKGIFFLLHTALPAYKDIKDNDRFKKLCEVDAKLRAAANENSKTTYKVELPENYDSNKKYPVMIILHGGGRNIDSPKPYWTSKVLKQNFIKVFMQSYSHRGSNSFGWGNHDIRAEEGIRDNFNEVVSQYWVDTENVFIGGISAGGSATFDMAIINPLINLKGVISICPAIAGEDFTKEQMETFKNSGTELHIITGEKDWGLEKQKEVMAMLDQAGAEYKVTIIPGMGHEYPEDFHLRVDNILSSYNK